MRAFLLGAAPFLLAPTLWAQGEGNFDGFGPGIGVAIAERVSLRAEYEVVEIDQLDDGHAVWLTAAARF